MRIQTGIIDTLNPNVTIIAISRYLDERFAYGVFGTGDPEPNDSKLIDGLIKFLSKVKTVVSTDNDGTPVVTINGGDATTADEQSDVNEEELVSEEDSLLENSKTLTDAGLDPTLITGQIKDYAMLVKAKKAKIVNVPCYYYKGNERKELPFSRQLLVIFPEALKIKPIVNGFDRDTWYTAIRSYMMENVGKDIINNLPPGLVAAHTILEIGNVSNGKAAANYGNIGNIQKPFGAVKIVNGKRSFVVDAKEINSKWYALVEGGDQTSDGQRYNFYSEVSLNLSNALDRYISIMFKTNDYFLAFLEACKMDGDNRGFALMKGLYDRKYFTGAPNNPATRIMNTVNDIYISLSKSNTVVEADNVIVADLKNRLKKYFDEVKNDKYNEYL